jgi:methyl-accepting chemotaxis protein
MNWFKNLKVSVKLLTGFAFASLVAVLIGILNLSSLGTMIDGKNEIYDNNLVPIKLLGDIHAGMLKVRGDARSILASKSAEDKNSFIALCANQLPALNSMIDKYISVVNTGENGELAKKIREAWNKYTPALERGMQFARQGDDTQTWNVFQNECTPVLNATFADMEKLIEQSSKKAEEVSKNMDSVISNTKTTVIVILLISFVIIIAIGMYISKLITKPIEQADFVIGELNKGRIRDRMDWESKDELGDMANKINQYADFLQRYIMNIYKISDGDFGYKREIQDDKNEMAPALETIVATLKELKVETDVMAEHYADGDTDYNGNSGKFKGGYKELVDGFNASVSHVIDVVRQGTHTLGLIASGDLTARMEGEFKNNYKVYQNQINGVAASLEEVVSQVTDSVAATVSASTQISASSEEMATGAQEQSTQTVEIASAVEEMTKTILETTKNAADAADSAKKSGDFAKEGGHVVKETIEGMGRIAEVVNKSAETVQALGKSSDQIGEIIQVIDDIADQTNLLALNAAIEAARAGEQGRGFAVVADEVRKLAERTTKATKEIAQMIKQIQKDTGEAVESMQLGTTEVEKGKMLTDRAGNALREIIANADEVVNIITQVASASHEQSAAAEQISKNIEAITSVTQQSAAGTQQIARAADDLNQLTNGLQNAVARFKISNNAHYLDNSGSRTAGSKNRLIRA